MLHVKLKSFVVIIAFAAAIAACGDDPASVDVDGPGESELITSVTLTLEELDDQGNATGTTVSAVWDDSDGPGGSAPTIETLQLKQGTTYQGSIELLDTTKDPVENITEEVEEEADEHQFFYIFNVDGNESDTIQVTRNDTDSQGLALGLNYTLSVSNDAPEGGLRVILLHFEDAEKESNDFPAEQTGIDTDVDIEFPVQFE